MVSSDQKTILNRLYLQCKCLYYLQQAFCWPRWNVTVLSNMLRVNNNSIKKTSQTCSDLAVQIRTCHLLNSFWCSYCRIWTSFTVARTDIHFRPMFHFRQNHTADFHYRLTTCFLYQQIIGREGLRIILI